MGIILIWFGRTVIPLASEDFCFCKVWYLKCWKWKMSSSVLVHNIKIASKKAISDDWEICVQPLVLRILPLKSGNAALGEMLLRSCLWLRLTSTRDVCSSLLKSPLRENCPLRQDIWDVNSTQEQELSDLSAALCLKRSVFTCLRLFKPILKDFTKPSLPAVSPWEQALV